MWLEFEIDKAYTLTYMDGFKVKRDKCRLKIEPVKFEKLIITNDYSEDADDFLTFAIDENGTGKICFGAEKGGKKIDMAYLKANMRCIQDCMYLEEGETDG